MPISKGAKVIRTQGGGTLIKPVPPPPKSTTGDDMKLKLTFVKKDDTVEKKSATDEVEERIAALIHAHPSTMTRAIAQDEVFSADRDLYERYRAENTIGRDGQVLNPDPSSLDNNMGIGRVTAKSDVDAEVAKRVHELMSKTAGSTREQAMDFVFRHDRALYEHWRNQYANV
jgi:hypothetical protein